MSFRCVLIRAPLQTARQQHREVARPAGSLRFTDKDWSQRLSLVGDVSLTGVAINLLYWSASDGEQIISRTSKSGGCNFMGNLSRANQGSVYIFGSSIFTV